MNERSIDCPPELHDYYLNQRKMSRPHASLDGVEGIRRGQSNDRDLHQSSENIHRYSPPLITPQSLTGFAGEYASSRGLQNNTEYADRRAAGDYHDYQNLQKIAIDQQFKFEDSVDKIAKGYDLVKASMIYNDSFENNR